MNCEVSNMLLCTLRAVWGFHVGFLFRSYNYLFIYTNFMDSLKFLCTYNRDRPHNLEFFTIKKLYVNWFLHFILRRKLLVYIEMPCR